MPEAAGLAVRAATPADLGAIRDIELAAFEPSRRSSTRSLRRTLRSPFQRVQVAELEARVAGFVIVWPYRHTWRIYNLATDPRWRNRGVAGTLLGAVEREARGRGARRLVLESQPGGALERFYQQRGFRVAERLRDYYAAGLDAVRMELMLQSPLTA